MTNPTPVPTADSQPRIANRANRANRANARLSTGPRTAAGKERSSQNALTHGLTSRSPVLATEDPAAFQLHRRQFFFIVRRKDLIGVAGIAGDVGDVHEVSLARRSRASLLPFAFQLRDALFG